MTDDHIDEKIRRLKLSRDTVRQAEAALSEAIKDLFPAGSMIRWKRGTNVQVGHVTATSYGDSLFVINRRTGANLKISAFDIVQALETDEEAA